VSCYDIFTGIVCSFVVVLNNYEEKIMVLASLFPLHFFQKQMNFYAAGSKRNDFFIRSKEQWMRTARFIKKITKNNFQLFENQLFYACSFHV
jgi:hypothetical protein